jgi:hypothetical protein
MALQGKLLNTNSAIYVIVLIWWIVCLWIDEPRTTVASDIDLKAPVREYLDANGTSEHSES